MPRKASTKVQEGSSAVHAHSSGKDHTTHASGEQKKGKSTLMAGIVSGMPKKNLPPTLDGIVRGVAKHGGVSLSADTMHVKGSATRQEEGAFGAGAFPQGQMGR
jgi:hypothetical protein